MKTFITLLTLFLVSIFPMIAQNNLSAKEIVKKADDKLRGESNIAEIKMTIVRPTWQREVTLKSWSLGDDYSLILVIAPARDKGTAFLKRDKEIWNWQPTIDRTIKMPPSMMSQSWMGSDFTNDDLVRESSTVNDYNHKMLGSESVDGRDCYKIELIPKEDAAVVWGKIITWIDKKDFMQMKAEFYDEDNYLVNTMLGKNVKTLGGKTLPSVMEVIPAEKTNQKTRIEYLSLEFDKPIQASFFSIQNMKKVK
ncbi:MAG: outer membrane lipoprotein-sorting protein [Saprospiraceae bacterium]|nr:outer membrane lipoprotein-sorting protein [Saprospiraceae bacterium]